MVTEEKVIPKVVEETDDFDLSKLNSGGKSADDKKPAVIPDEVGEGDEDKKDEGKKDDGEEKKKGDEGEKDEGKTDDDETFFEGDDKKKDEPAKPKKVKEVDIFADETPADEKPKRTIKEVAKKFDVDLEKDDDYDEFETKISDKISKSRQELNLDGYSPDARALIKHLNENEGDIDSFFSNKNIIGYQSVLALDPEAKVRQIRYGEILSSGLAPDKAKETLEEEFKALSTREIKDMADNIDSQAKELIQQEVKTIVGDREIKKAADKEKFEKQQVQERTNLKTFIDSQEEFLGFPLSKDARKSIQRDIDNGVFDKVLEQSPEQRKFSAYMFSKYGKKIIDKIENSLSESNRAGYNTATKKALEGLHKIDEKQGAGKSGHDKVASPGSKGDKPGWTREDLE